MTSPEPAGLASGPSPLLGRPGAVTSDTAPDRGLAWHYGDPMGEQRAAQTGAVLLDRWTSGHVTVAGPDRHSWLHTLSSQQLSDLAEGAATEALWLSTQGHVEHWADITELDGTAHLRTEPAAAGPLHAYLESMKFWSKVELADATETWASMTVAGPDATDIIGRALQLPAPPAGRAVAVTKGPATGGFLRGYPDRVDVVVLRESFPAVASELIRAGAVPAGSWAAAALRVPARRPRFGVDNDERTIPNELPWLATAVHLHKGCYRGQETVARVDNLGQPPRRLAVLHLDGSAETLPVTGDPVLTDQGRTVGRVGTVAQHWEDGPIALALVKRNIQPGTPLLAGGVDAAMDPDDAVAGGRRSSVDRGALPDLRRR